MTHFQSAKILLALQNFWAGKYRRSVLVVVISTLVMTACAVNQEDADLTPGTDLAGLKTMYVVRLAADERGVNVMIRDKLNELGVSAKTGEEADQPDNVDAIVTYLDKWQWDLTMYMIELQIIIRDPDSNFPFATGKSFHTSLTRLSPEKMVAEVLDNIYEKAQ